MTKLCALLLLAVAPLALADAPKHGALAFSEASHRYGWSVEQATQEEADQKALAHCGAGCTIRLDWDHGCGAYAEGPHEHHYGWAHEDTREHAEAAALLDCRKRGGEACTIRVWSCN